MHYRDRTVGYVIAKESSRDSSTKLLYCTEATVAMMMQAYLVSSDQPTSQELITTVIFDEVHNRSAHSDYVLASHWQQFETPDERQEITTLCVNPSLSDW